MGADEKIWEMSSSYFLITGLGFLGSAFNMIFGSVLKGYGDSKRTFLVSALTLWIVRVFGSWSAIHILQTGIYGAWICMALENAARGVLLIVSYKVIGMRGAISDKNSINNKKEV